MNKTLLKERVLTVPRVAQSSQIDQEAKRRQVLAKVYSLLIRLAEKAENHTDIPDVVTEQEKIGELTPIQADPVTEEA